jgi:hypothetical protein
VRSEQRGKTANWPRPGGLGCVGEAPSLCPLPKKAKRGRFAYTALPAAHFDRNERYAYFVDRTLGGFAFQGFLARYAAKNANNVLIFIHC